MKTAALLLAATLGLGAGPRLARAYDPATTHAGLTQRAAVASTLHAVLARRFGRPLGLFETLTLRGDRLPVDEWRFLSSRLGALDPAGGYRPEDGGKATALAWTVAGSVIAWTPAERGQNSFLDPSRGGGVGLDDGGGLADLGQSLRGLLDGGSLRGWATGTDFGLSGQPSTKWVQSAGNDVGLPSFYDELVLAVAGTDREARGTALARALLSLGGVLGVLEDAGEPARVRNDFQGAFLRSGGTGPFSRSSAFERFVAEGYGIAGVPVAGKAIERRNAIAYLTDGDGQGLADRTQRRFFSDGTVPDDGIVDRDTTARDVVRGARESMTYGLPGLPRLELGDMGRTHYVYAVASAERKGRLVLTSTFPKAPPSGSPPEMRRLLAYRRVPGRVRFFLDRRVYEDTARVLLPEIGAYAAGLIDHLFRGEVTLAIDGGAATVAVTGARGAIRSGTVRLFAEDKAGARREIGSAPWPAASAGSAPPITMAVPAGTRVIAAAFRGEDDAGVLVAVGEQSVP